MAAQNQALESRAYSVIVLIEQGSKKCRTCDKHDETVTHILINVLSWLRLSIKSTIIK